MAGPYRAAMSEHHHGPRTIERHADVAILTGSSAGLAAASELAGRGWSVIVVDAGGAAGDGAGPQGTDAEREAVRRDGVEVLAGMAIDVEEGGDGPARVRLTGGHAIVARRVLAADAVTTGAGGAAGVEVADDLDAEDAAAGGRPSANQADWDHRYGGEQMWSGNPNGTLVHEVTGMTPGRALDIGAGEGGDVIWLAEQGWTVTANDISGRALDRVRAEASRRGLEVAACHADVNDADPFPAGRFDLVTAHYASIPRRADGRGVANLIGAVAPGGTLLVVSHDLAPMRAPIDPRQTSRAFDPDAYVRVEDVAAALAEDDGGWDIEVHGSRPRPPGAVSTHHVDDVVLRARRRAG